MGIWNLLKNLNNAEGVREAMRMSYDKHLAQAKSDTLSSPETTPHEIALFGALATRYQTHGVTQPEVLLWGELAPFMGLSNADGRECLAEYVVYCERRADAKADSLRAKINAGICRLDPDRKRMASMAAHTGATWASLLDDGVRRALDALVAD